MDEIEKLRGLAQRLRWSRSAIAFTGAGISTESGIGDFRSPGGVWSRHQPVLYQEFIASSEARRRYWAIRKETYGQFAGAKPNLAHRTLAELEAAGGLRAVITQNIDRLHQMAGSRKVLELHGNAREIVCLGCRQVSQAEEIHSRLEAGEEVPECHACGGILKAATVSFGQPLPPAVLEEAERLSREADLFLAIGSSLVVTPAATLPALARRAGAFLAIINREETPQDPIADLVVRTPIGEAFQILGTATGF
ncbi:MAG: Sir2 family NAD-dependent protein deacetylase [Planctomycetes bacterium]|nr:Sir2 family NAD-dependent protein deacetylase [Planctomycetota bacterium]